MLPAYIIDQLRRREQARREEQSRPQPRLEIPQPMPHERADRASSPDGVERGVTIVELF